MSNLQLLSLGGWCRPAFQIHRFAIGQEARVTALRGPFDWTITPYTALRTCLAPGFVPQTVLQPGQCHISYAGSAACSVTGVIFHHRLAPELMEGLGYTTPGAPIASSDAFDPLAKDARGRFAHTYRYLTGLQDHDGDTLFVRWQRQGHPDQQVPTAFAEETTADLMKNLGRFLGHRRFYLLTVVSHITRDRTEPFEAPIVSWKTKGRAMTCHLQERFGWNGDQSANFKGDDDSWSAALQAAMDRVTTHRQSLPEVLARYAAGRYRSVMPPT